MHENGEIDLSSSRDLPPDVAASTQTNGFFDFIKGTFLAIFLKNEVIYVAAGTNHEDLNRVVIHYNISESGRFLKIESMNLIIDLSYQLTDLVRDPGLLLGSHEEPEDYDFGCYIYNIKRSPERQDLIRESWK